MPVSVGLEALDAWLLGAIHLPILLPTAVAMIAEAWLFYMHVEITHPMYAVLMQECVTLATIACFAVGCLVAALWVPEAGLAALAALLTIGSNIHQSSWLVITGLR